MVAKLSLLISVLAAALTCVSLAQAEGNSPLSQGEHYAKINGLSLWYKVGGGGGPVAILPTPSWGPSSELYFHNFKKLEEKFNIVYLDTRGTGKSERPDSFEKYSYDYTVSDIESLRRLFKKEKIWVIGHSLGGVLAQMYALRNPKHAAGLILFDTTANYMTPEYLADVNIQLNRLKVYPWFSTAMANENAFDSHGPFATDEELAKGLDSSLELYVHNSEVLKNIRANNFYGTSFSVDAYNAYLKWLHPVDLRLEEKRLNTPAVIVSGEFDPFCSTQMGEEIHFALKNSRFIMIQDSGHFPFLDNPEQTWSSILRALKSLNIN